MQRNGNNANIGIRGFLLRENKKFQNVTHSEYGTQAASDFKTNTLLSGLT